MVGAECARGLGGGVAQRAPLLLAARVGGEFGAAEGVEVGGVFGVEALGEELSLCSALELIALSPATK